MNWRYITAAALFAATFAVLFEYRSEKGFVGLAERTKVVAFQLIDPDSYHPVVRQMEECRINLLLWHSELPIAIDGYPDHNRGFYCRVELDDPSDALIAHAEDWLYTQFSNASEWSIIAADEFREGSYAVFHRGPGIQLHPHGELAELLDVNVLPFHAGLMFAETRNFCVLPQRKLIFSIDATPTELGLVGDICF